MKTILITGGSSGIGKALVYLAAKKGYYVIFTYNQKKNSAFNIKKKLGKNCLAIKVNFLKDNAVNNLFKILIKKKLRIDYVVNNAAFNVKRKKFLDLSIDEVKKIYKVNVFAIYEIIKHCIRLLPKNKNWKTIINISSTAAKFGGRLYTHYAPTKAAIENLTLGLSKELAEKKIRVLCVAPGIISSKLENIENKKILKSIPNGRLGTPDEVAKLVLWLISDEAEYINGTTITISGGR
jgi:NAD(P)-dependent dehydrogenase (short-subunit alcohol dehydrogenase family)